MMKSFMLPPPHQTFALISFPAPHILLVTFNRPKQLNAITQAGNYELEQLFSWYDNEPSLYCAVVTGSGRAFCAGADLKEWNQRSQKIARGESDDGTPVFPPSGFGALSRRRGKKPVIGAINGLAFGGGMEIVANLDLVIAGKSALFALPEVDRGVVAFAGALPRITRTIGKPRAMEMALTGRRVSVEEAEKWGFVNEIVDDRKLVERALEIAKTIASKSPDSIIISRAGVISAWEEGSAENASRIVSEQWEARLNRGDNLAEGLAAFVEKRGPIWRDSKL